jgi:hypothetical protein
MKRAPTIVIPSPSLVIPSEARNLLFLFFTAKADSSSVVVATSSE